MQYLTIWASTYTYDHTYDTTGDRQCDVLRVNVTYGGQGRNHSLSGLPVTYCQCPFVHPHIPMVTHRTPQGIDSVTSYVWTWPMVGRAGTIACLDCLWRIASVCRYTHCAYCRMCGLQVNGQCDVTCVCMISGECGVDGPCVLAGLHLASPVFSCGFTWFIRTISLGNI